MKYTLFTPLEVKNQRFLSKSYFGLLIGFILFFLTFLGFSPIVHAQLGSIGQDDVHISMIPENPGPNQFVEVSIQSYSTNINAAEVTWRINGAVKSTGKGVRTFTFTTGGMNTTTTLGITVETAEGEVVEQTVRIRPTSVDLIWQTESFTPPFYKGKALFSHQNQITFIALPHITGSNGVEIGAKNLIYKWTQGGSVIESASGYGKNTYTTAGSIISRPLEVDVEVTSGSADGIGIAGVIVGPVTPAIVMYEKNPLYGIQFQRALGGTVGLSDSREITVVAMPFFFGARNSNVPELSYRWSVNGTVTSTEGGQNTQVFRREGDASGTSRISLSIENANSILQSAKNEFNLTF